jgi:phenylalanyl-tRNA synthetase alpha chain
MEQELQSLKQLALLELSQAENMDALNELRVKYLGKKGSLTSA